MKLKEKSHYKNCKFADYLVDREHCIYVESYFKEILSLERKRAERSRKPFLLMLIDVEQFGDISERKDVVNRIASILFHCTRETDTKGWYKKDAIVGILFTELGSNDSQQFTESLYSKIHNSLCNIMNNTEINKVKLDIFVYPKEPIQTESEKHHTVFYPDIKKKLSSEKVVNKVKRGIDILGSIGGIMLFSPFFISIPFLIKLTSKGPILFKQERVGLFGKKFTFLKFRSMYINNDDKIHKDYIANFINEQKAFEDKGGNGKNGDQRKTFKILRDPRITPIGHFIRKTSLDELPQFFNVLKGDMSLVGPRPPIPYECDHYDIWHKKRIFEIKPGITGLWQVEGRSSTNFDEMVRLDIQYIREWSFWLDFKILLKTPWVVIAGRGAH